MTSYIELRSFNSQAVINRCQSQEGDSNCNKTARKIAYYVGAVFFCLGAVVAGAMFVSAISVIHFFYLSAPVLATAFGIGCAVAIPSMILGNFLMQPHRYALNEQKLEERSLTDITRISAWSERGEVGRSPLVFGWDRVIQYYGGSSSHRASICSVNELKAGRKNFDQLKARIQREIQEADKPFIYACQICESLEFTARDNQLSADENRVKQMILEALQDRIGDMSIRELIPCFSFSKPLDDEELNQG